MLFGMVRCSLVSISSLILAGCCLGARPEPATERITTNDDEAEPFLRADGTLEPDACMELCQDHVDFVVDECELVSHDPELTQAWLFECSGEYPAVCF